jgi:hypothetical protein
MAVCAIVAGSGSKKKSGGEWRDSDFWTYETERSKAIDINSEDYRLWYYNLKKIHNLP